MLLFLTGFSGCGKSTAGRRLAERLGYSFVDLDAAIVAREGRSINEIFTQSGEEEFRRLESAELENIIASTENTIVATGGGTPCFRDNMELMLAAGTVVYFRMSPENLALRLQHGRERRPKLAAINDAELTEYIAQSLAGREPYYMRSGVVIDCNGVDDAYLAEHLGLILELNSFSRK